MYSKYQPINYYENMVKMIKVGRYPNKDAMELKITNVVAEGLITVEQGNDLKELLDKKENGELGIN